jgi:hypothetical protein
MAAATSANVFGLIGVVTYVILISVLNYQLAIRSFNLITQVPDRVARWFGAQPDGDGEHQQASMAVAAAGAYTENTMTQAVDAGKGAFFAKPGEMNRLVTALEQTADTGGGSVTAAGKASGVSKANRAAAGGFRAPRISDPEAAWNDGGEQAAGDGRPAEGPKPDGGGRLKRGG